jgi:hypothetical protein
MHVPHARMLSPHLRQHAAESRLSLITSVVTCILNIHGLHGTPSTFVCSGEQQRGPLEGGRRGAAEWTQTAARGRVNSNKVSASSRPDAVAVEAIAIMRLNTPVMQCCG